jgi:hypothetical protein
MADKPTFQVKFACDPYEPFYWHPMMLNSRAINRSLGAMILLFIIVEDE